MCLKITAVILTSLTIVYLLTGCGTLRFAPGEKQKQNVYLHQRTVEAAAIRAHNENASEVLNKLTSRASQQSNAILAYFGLPKNVPATESIDEILNQENEAITQNAHLEAIQRPDPWDVADNLMELSIAVAGLMGGVLGSRVVTTLTLAREKSIALREIVAGNELFKKKNPQLVQTFKESQQIQNPATRKLVVAMK